MRWKGQTVRDEDGIMPEREGCVVVWSLGAAGLVGLGLLLAAAREGAQLPVLLYLALLSLFLAAWCEKERRK